MINTTVYMIDPAAVIRGTIPYRTATVVSRYNLVGSWTVTAPLTRDVMRAAAAGWRIVIVDDYGTVCSGPVRGATMTAGSDSEDTGGGRPVPQLVLTGPDDNCLFTDVLAWPTPGAALTAQQNAWDFRQGQASTVFRAYVNANVGPGARAERVNSALVLDPDPAIGGNVTGRARFDSLLDLFSPLALSAGVGFRVVGDCAPTRRFQVFAPRDLTGRARFSLPLRNLRQLKWDMTAPEATVVIAGGQGTLENKQFAGAENASATAAWGRIEGFSDQRQASSSDGRAELTTAAQTALGERSANVQTEISPVDGAALAYGRDYGLGDRVTVEVFADKVLSSVIREVEIRIDHERGRRVIPRIGEVRATAAPRKDQVLKAAVAGLSAMVRSV